MTLLRRLMLVALLFGAAPALAAMKLGVNTHYDQGWPLATFDRAVQAGAGGIRDTVTWGKVEQSPGVYTFTAQNSGYVEHACRNAMPVLIVLAPRNKIYDGGMAVTSEAGRSAFARYVVALTGRFPCIVGIEVGNEINSPSRKWPPPSEMPAAYVAILKDVRAALKERHPDVALVGGSSLMVATGFLEKLFAVGMLPLVDAVAVHPYTDTPEQLPWQFEHLNEAMARHGGVKPIWSTEFGLYYKTPEAAPPHALKAITVMSAAHVGQAYWYALLDEKYFPNMGLYAGGTPKPALDTFRLAARRLLRAGDARRIDTGDHLTYIYQFGSGPYVMWGSGRPIGFSGDPAAYDARGRRVPAPTLLGPDPIVVDAPASYRLGAPLILADTLYDFDEWSHLVLTPAGKGMPMRWIDSTWASYVGLPGAPNFQATAPAVMVGGSPAAPKSLVERYTSPAARKVWISACFEPRKEAAVTVRISHAGRDLHAARIDGPQQFPLLEVALGAGESLDVSYTADAAGGPFMLRRRVRILAEPERSPAQCIPDIVGKAQ